MRLRPSLKLLSASLALSMLAPTLASAASITASVATECSRMRGRARASCELSFTKGRPIRREVKDKAHAFMKAHRKITKNASELKVHTVPVNPSSH